MPALSTTVIHTPSGLSTSRRRCKATSNSRGDAPDSYAVRVAPVVDRERMRVGHATVWCVLVYRRVYCTNHAGARCAAGGTPRYPLGGVEDAFRRAPIPARSTRGRSAPRVPDFLKPRKTPCLKPLASAEIRDRRRQRKSARNPVPRRPPRAPSHARCQAPGLPCDQSARSSRRGRAGSRRSARASCLRWQAFPRRRIPWLDRAVLADGDRRSQVIGR
jgi:hypothetical protein